MSEIRRIGPPSARDVKGRLVTWTAPLSAMPAREWRQFFLQTRDTTVTCSPKHVHMYQSMMVFESTEEDVATWIGLVDKWVADANARYAQWETDRQRVRDSAATGADRDRRLLDLNEKFKNL